MYDIFEFEVTGKDMALAVLIVFVLLLGAGFAGYLLGWERAEDVYCNGSGVAGVGSQIGQAESNISNATSGIEAAHGHADQVASGIESAKESVNYIQGTANTSAGIIAECQQILAGIRQRTNKNTSTH